jgi:LPS-assembly protein
MMRLFLRLCWVVFGLTLWAGEAGAQLSNLAATTTGGGMVSASDPVTFTADEVEYDREGGLVIARGRVEAWQNGRVMRADRITFDRNTGVAAAIGNVVFMDLDGQVVFADYAEMSRNMRDGVMKEMRGLLPENGRLAATGMRRTDGQINELAKVVYSTCDLCKKDPTRPPLWEVRAASAVQDLENKMIEYHDASLRMWGVPVAYTPYFFHPDPSVKRQSGLLPPAMGIGSRVGGFYQQPYYWAIDDQSDATITPTITTRSGPDLNVEYRRRFNSGFVVINPSVGYTDNSMQGAIASRGRFNLDNDWRWGFDVNRASSVRYLLNFNRAASFAGNLNLLNSQIFVEGFGVGAYARLDARAYQSLSRLTPSSRLPVVAPRAQYSYFGRPDSWGGRTSLSLDTFNVMRTDGTTTRRARMSLAWERPFTGALGDLWNVTLRNDAIAYDAVHLNDQPNFGRAGRINTGRGLPQVAVDFRWPFARDGGAWGRQLIEPIAQIIAAPQTGDSQLYRYPNEDSLDFEFSDANLFGFNRFPGVDRLEGGVRANVALRGAWYLGGTAFEGIIGQSYRTTKNTVFPRDSGLYDQVSDVVMRGTFSPNKYLDLTYRTRLDKRTMATRMAEATTSFGTQELRVTGGYFYSSTNPNTYYVQPAPPPAGHDYYRARNELIAGVGSDLGSALGPVRFQGFVRQDLSNKRLVAFGADLIYEDECFIFDLRVYRRYTSINNDNGSTTVLLLFTFKTLGEFGYRAL